MNYRTTMTFLNLALLLLLTTITGCNKEETTELLPDISGLRRGDELIEIENRTSGDDKVSMNNYNVH